jgi:hypothetical protein
MQENVRTFQISMENFDIMQRFQASDDLNEYLPNVVFLYVLLVLLMSRDFLEQITVI